MSRLSFMFIVCALAGAARGAWYWPFGSNKEEKPRIYELMEPVSQIIDQAAEDAEEGRVSDAIAGYRRAIAELDRIEIENPDRAESAEFTTVRKKRALANAAIDSLVFKQARDNSKPVAVSDTTDLQKRFDRMQARKAEAKDKKNAAVNGGDAKSEAAKADPPKKSDADRKELLKAATLLLQDGEYEDAKRCVWELLDEKPNDAAALNLRAAIEAEIGDLKAAERTLNQSIRSNPKGYHAYINMARLVLVSRGEEGRFSARRYYETALVFGAPKDAALEAALKESDEESIEVDGVIGQGEDEPDRDAEVRPVTKEKTSK